jgi:transcriptional regulator with XRE-family HTH domain
MPRKKKQDLGFGPRLAAIRKARGLTQVQLAKTAQTTQRAISYYETDDGVPPASAVIALARALQVSTDELLGLRAPKIERLKEDDPETRRLWKRFRQVSSLPERDRKAVIRLINSLVSVCAPQRARAS